MRRVFSARALRFWRGNAQADTAADRHGPRIAVIGNCQARGIVQSLQVLAPEARATLMPMGRLGKDHRSLKAFAASLRGYDHVFSQAFPGGFFPDGGSDELIRLLPQARLFPAIVFSAFHPDAVYVGDLGSMARMKHTPSPLHLYHSAITLFGFLRGLSAPRIMSLFREDAFARLGYLDVWDVSSGDLLASSRAIGFDLGPDLLRWSRAGAFMHTINHPKLFVLGDIAARLLREAGLPPAAIPLDAYLADELLDDVIWPVYGPVAAVYGVNGSYLFKRRRLGAANPSLLQLDEFVSESLALYRRIPAARLRCHRTEHWARSPAICALFDAA